MTTDKMTVLTYSSVHNKSFHDIHVDDVGMMLYMHMIMQTVMHTIMHIIIPAEINMQRSIYTDHVCGYEIYTNY